jgi:hypothetical protein
MTTEPDYTLTITRENNGYVVYEGGESISNRFDNLAEAEWWLEQHRLWHQPCCCICGSAESLSDDPWDDFGVDRYGPDWTHTSCKEKFEYWARTEGPRGVAISKLTTNQKGHGAASLASVAKEVRLRHDKYPAP